MVGVVGSSPIVPTNFYLIAPTVVAIAALQKIWKQVTKIHKMEAQVASIFVFCSANFRAPLSNHIDFIVIHAAASTHCLLVNAAVHTWTTLHIRAPPISQHRFDIRNAFRTIRLPA